MSRERLSAIAHSSLPFAAPWSEATADEVIGALDLTPRARVVDLGCGWAELLVRVVERYDAVAEGVERSADAVERARATTLLRGPGRVTLRQADIAEVELPSASYDLVICVGSTHLFGGLGGTLAEARRLLTPRGRLLVGDGAWTSTPTPAAMAGLGAEPGDLPDSEGLQAAARESGFSELRSWVSSESEWDHYESTWCDSLEQWAAANPGDPDAAAARELADEHRRGYLEGYRGVLGFVTVLATT